MIDEIGLRQRLLDEFRWDRRLDATHVSVTVAKGVVTLTGHVPSYAELFAARRVARRIEGVKSVADELEVRLSSNHVRDASDIAESIAHVLQFNVSLPDSEIRAEVRDGAVTLHGVVDWQAHRWHVEKQVAHVSGVRSIQNHIKLRDRARPNDVKKQIEDALARNAEVEADQVSVRVDGDTVTLDGTVKVLYERDLVECATWSAPGVHEIIDNIRVA